MHPNICISEAMAELPAEVERTYVRLWTHCDDHGRCVDNVKLIKAAIYPLHDDMTLEVLDAHLDRLVAGRHLVGYEVNGREFLQVREWTVYQHPQRPKDSPIPVRDGSARLTRVVNAMHGEVRDTDAQEGRGDCADESATVPRNPSRLEEATRTLKSVRGAT